MNFKYYKAIIFLLINFFIFISLLVAKETKGFDLELGRYYMSVTPKVLEDGVQYDLSFGLFYTDAMKLAGEIRFRSVKTSGNDEVWEIADSLLAWDQQVYEVFLLPLNWHFFKKSGFTLRAGAGLYYNYSRLEEKGYFNDSSLYEPAGPDHYNAYGNDFTGHALGPMLDAGLSWHKGSFYASFSSGVVPIFYLNQKQAWKLSPLIHPPSYTVSGESSSGPYYYFSLDMALNLKYLSLFFTLFHEYSRLSYTAVGFDDAGTWTSFDVIKEYRVLALEISLLINLGLGGFMPQIGYGRTFDEASGGKNYLLLGVKKFLF
jgi:hypothetical protein